MEVAKQQGGQKSVSGKQGVNGGHDDSLLDNLAALDLPTEVIKRINALKNIQVSMIDIETNFYDELHKLECKYAHMMEPLLNQREKIVNGQYEPTEAECEWHVDDLTGSKQLALADEFKNKAKISEAESEKSATELAKGVPEFWLQAMKNTDIIGETIQEHDEPILKHLTDVRVRLHDAKPYGYTLEFYFSQNEYFTNKVLTKTYELTTDKDVRDPLGYDGPSLYRSVGCKIDWIKGKDVTVQLVKKKQKHKSSGTIRVVTKEEKCDSFFNFFESPTDDGYRPSFKPVLKNLQNGDNKAPADDNNEDNEELDEDIEDLFEADFEIGHFFKEFLIPKAVLYFTGELIDENEEEFDDDENDDDDDHKVRP